MCCTGVTLAELSSPEVSGVFGQMLAQSCILPFLSHYLDKADIIDVEKNVGQLTHHTSREVLKVTIITFSCRNVHGRVYDLSWHKRARIALSFIDRHKNQRNQSIALAFNLIRSTQGKCGQGKCSQWSVIGSNSFSLGAFLCLSF